jgi:Fungal specific transcription factor domain
VNITANTDSDYRTVIFDPYTEALANFQDSRVYGAMFGCAQDLVQLIPSICNLGYRRLAEESNGECYFETVVLYESIKSKIQNWQPPEIIPRDDYSIKDRVMAAKIYQQALLLFLHANFYGSNVSDPTLLALVDETLEMLFPVVADLPEDTPVMSTLLWPCLIIGSCLRDPLHRMALRQIMLASPYNMVLISQTVQILDWLWEDEGFGPYGLGSVMKKHKITHCVS